MIILIRLLAEIIFICTFGDGHRPDCNKTISNGSVLCCTNFYYNGHVCIECPDGYFGTNCSNSCQPPYYGRRCDKTCNCDESSCNHVYGCNTTAECPAGFFGNNCSVLCQYPQYGILCKEVCDCSNSSCHHVYGCTAPTRIVTDCSAGFVGDNCSAPCLFPQYGPLCNETCDCSNSSCHHIYGCSTTTLITTVPNAEENSGGKGQHTRMAIISIGVVLSTLLLVLIAREVYQLPHIREICGNRHQLPGGTLDEDNVYNEITLTLQDTSWK